MERLTERYSQSLVRIVGCTTAYSNKERKGANMQNAIVRLAAYEDSGLTPKEVFELTKVVRCRDCEMYREDGCVMSGFFGQRFYENDFCSKGRRRN